MPPSLAPFTPPPPLPRLVPSPPFLSPSLLVLPAMGSFRLSPSCTAPFGQLASARLGRRRPCVCPPHCTRRTAALARQPLEVSRNGGWGGGVGRTVRPPSSPPSPPPALPPLPPPYRLVSPWGEDLRVGAPADAGRSLVADASSMPHASLAPPCLTPLARCSPAVPVLHSSSPTTPHAPTSQATSSSTSATSARTRHHACRPLLLYHRCLPRAAVAAFFVGAGRQRQPLHQRLQRRRSMRWPRLGGADWSV
ncbi:hypothetical protein I4F81_009682 [Pyropia yezoensis]|uniref:Uncharacterized protein n=1 Tax=Pyropia yezoensis TaxID=2788 RepID=A0ACC3CAS5_PYRYE|nr:hypothetical protein I4F81_009682 [Neopyropia yezoensis]